MGLTLKEEEFEPREPIPEGSYDAVCYSIIDLGTQPGGQYDPKKEVQFTWEIPELRISFEKDGKEIEGPKVVGARYTQSLGDRANLRKMLDSWRGVAFTPEELEGFSLHKVLSICCTIQIVHGKSADGKKTYANINAVTPLHKSVKPFQPENTPIFFEIEKATTIPGSIPKWIREKIEASPEWDWQVNGSKVEVGGHTAEDKAGDMPLPEENTEPLF